MEPELKKAIALVEAAGYDVIPKDHTFNLQQLKICFNASRVSMNIRYPLNPDWFLYKDVNEYLKSINVCTPDSK